MATVLANIQSVARELGLTYPTSAANSTDELVLQLVSLMNRTGDFLLTELDSAVMTREYRFTTEVYTYTGDLTAGASSIVNMSSIANLSSDFMVSGTGLAQDTMVTEVSGSTVTLNRPATATGTTVTLTFGRVLYAVPSDFDHIVNKTHYNKTNQWEVIGPKTAQEWQFMKASFAATGPRVRWRMRGLGRFEVWPMPTTAVTLGYEYISNHWVFAEDASTKASLTADTDTAYFPDRLMILGTKLRFFEIKGFATDTLRADWMRELSKWKAQQGGADVLSFSPRAVELYPTSANIPDSGYGI